MINHIMVIVGIKWTVCRSVAIASLALFHEQDVCGSGESEQPRPKDERWKLMTDGRGVESPCARDGSGL